MKTAVDEWADFSAQQLENRLDRIWKQKQKEVSIPKNDHGFLTILLGNIFHVRSYKFLQEKAVELFAIKSCP